MNFIINKYKKWNGDKSPYREIKVNPDNTDPITPKKQVISYEVLEKHFDYIVDKNGELSTLSLTTLGKYITILSTKTGIKFEVLGKCYLEATVRRDSELLRRQEIRKM